jgi:hypothetical protein
MKYFNINESYKGGKGSVDGALSSHSLTKNLPLYMVIEFIGYQKVEHAIGSFPQLTSE